MKTHFFIFGISLFIALFGQTQNNSKKEISDDKTFAKVDSLLEKNQPNAAQKELWNILAEAKKEKNEFIPIKAISYFKQTLAPLEQTERTELYFKLLEETQNFSSPTNSLLELSLLQEFSFNFREWFGYSHSAYYDSIDFGLPETKFQFVYPKIKTLENHLNTFAAYGFKDYQKVLPSVKDSLFLFRTLSDYVAYQIIDLYQSNLIQHESYLKNSTEKNKNWYATPDVFSTLDFKEESLTTTILKLYQNIEKNNLHFPDYQSVAVYQRLTYLANQFSNSEEMKEVWQRQFDFFHAVSARSKFLFEREKIKYEEGLEYHYIVKPKVENYLKEVHESLQKELKKFPDNDFKSEIAALIQQIESQEIYITFPDIISPGKKIPLLVSYRNHSDYYLRIYKIKNEDPLNKNSLKGYVQKEQLELVQTLHLTFKNQNQFQKRTYETLLPAISAPGCYFLVGSANNENLFDNAFDDKKWEKLKLFSSSFSVSEIAVTTSSFENVYSILVVEQKTGKPVKNAEISLYNFNYRTNKQNLIQKGKTNEEGLFVFPFSENSFKNNSVIYIVKHGESVLYGSKYLYETGKQRERAFTKIISDRAVYRPGQTAYFKVIAYQGKENDFKTLSNQKISVTIRDVNYSQVFQEEYTTNEWGSIDGSFPIPKGKITGNFYIRAEVIQKNEVSSSSNHYFLVEEYKRPTFEVKLNNPKGEAKLDAQIQLTGNAKAFAGFPISNAQVAYSVYRSWNQRWIYWENNSHEDLLKEGALKTDEKGDFVIDFFAESDPNAVKYAYYSYNIIAKVTDVSGETHEQSISLRLSKTGLSLQAIVPQQIFAHQDTVITTAVVNLAGEKQNGFTGKLDVYKKITSDIFLNRLWDNAETADFEEKDFMQLFPNMRLNTYEEYPKLEKIKSVTFTIGDTLSVHQLLDKIQGDFVLKFSSITKNGDTLKTENNLEIIDVTAKELPAHTDLWTFVSSPTAEVGKTVDFQVGSSFKNAKALVYFYRGKELISREWIDLNHRFSKCYKVEEKDRGILTYQVILFYNGIFYTDKKEITVPYSNKVLEIKTATFRDKLQPGQKEEWRFTIIDNDKKFIETELAASMYDASLDQIVSHNWHFSPYHLPWIHIEWGKEWSRTAHSIGHYSQYRAFQNLINQRFSKYKSANGSSQKYGGYYWIDGTRIGGEVMRLQNREAETTTADVESIDMAEPADKIQEESNSAAQSPKKEIGLRTNFNEAAFFYPFIYANSNQEYVLNFTLPESLTKWNLLLLAHTKEVQTGMLRKEIEAKKDFMITANAPRFLRQGDVFDFSAKVVNLTENDQLVTVQLQLENPETLSNLDFINGENSKTVIVPANSTEEVSWPLKIGETEMLQYTVSASNAHFSDGERNILPVLSNRVFITQTEHVLIREKGTETHSFDDFQKNASPTLENKTFTVEYIDNLAWQVVLALPYLAQGNGKSTTDLIDKYYANAIAEHIVKSTPQIQQLFELWKQKSPEVFFSELEKNEDLKNVLLQETPWVLEAKEESEQRRRIAQLFDFNQLDFQREVLFEEIKRKQNGDGGFSWFDGGKSNVYITQYLLNRLSNLNQLKISTTKFETLLRAAEKYLANEQVKYYQERLKTTKNRNNYRVSPLDLQWLYSRLFFSHSSTVQIEEMEQFYTEKLKKDWVSFTPYLQGMAGIYFHKKGLKKEADIIYASLIDRAKTSKTLGMFWVENSGWYWTENKISAQAMLLSFFKEMNVSDKILEEARLWLILNKEANAWETGTETADAIYAILLTGKDYLKDTPQPKISIHNKQFVTEQPKNPNEIQVEFIPGLGQVKHKWWGEEISKDLGTIAIEKFSESPAVLNFYWQFTEDLSRIQTSKNTAISIHKKYQKLIPGVKGETSVEGTNFTVGDKIEVELIITIDRDLEFVHIKDLRPAGFEPSDTRSGYVWNKNLVYYQSPKDVSMEFFAENMAKGTYKLSYTVYATHSGKFNSGLATIQSYYAPKFSGHSATKELNIERP